MLLALQEACTVDDTGKKEPFWQKVRRKKTADCEVLQSVLRTAKPMGRWMFALLAAVLMLQGDDRSCEGGRRRSCSRKNSDHPTG